MEAEDIDDDGAEDEEAEAAGAGDGGEEAAEDFEGFDEAEVTGGVEGSHEEGGRAAGRRGFLRGEEGEEEVGAEGDEGEAEESGGGVGGWFHGVVFWCVSDGGAIAGWRDQARSMRMASADSPAVMVRLPASSVERASPADRVVPLTSRVPLMSWSQTPRPGRTEWVAAAADWRRMR